MTVETARRLGHRFLGCEPYDRFFESITLGQRRVRYGHAVLAPCPADDHLLEVHRRGLDQWQRSVEGRGDRSCHRLPVGRGFDDRRRAVGGYVSTGIYAGDARFERSRVDDQVTLRSQLRRFVTEEVQYGMLTDGQDHRIEGYLEL